MHEECVRRKVEKKKLSQSRALATKLVFKALSILKANGGEMPGRDLLAQVERETEMDDWAKHRYEKTGYIRWRSILHFFTIGIIKAGFLIKKSGIWYLTPEGDEALKLGEIGLLAAGDEGYKRWKDKQPAAAPEIHQDEIVEPDIEAVEDAAVELDQIEEQAYQGFERYIVDKSPYEFQDLVAALLRGMGYHTPFVAPKGKDGGIDIVAYRDPLGCSAPRIRAQVKHRETKATPEEIRALMGLLRRDGDVGIFVSRSGFTEDGRATARSSASHVELIDLKRLIDLWQEFYPKLNDDDKLLLPIRPIYFLAQST